MGTSKKKTTRKTKKSKNQKQDKKIANIEKVVGAVEPKILYTAFMMSVLAAVIIPLQDIAQGINNNGRIGDKINIINTEIHVSFQNGSNTFYDYCRMIVFKFDAVQAQVLSLAVGSFLEPPDAFGNLAYDSPLNNYTLDYKHKSNKLINSPGAIKILYDSGPKLLAPISAGNSMGARILKWSSNKIRSVNYSDPSATSASKGGLYALFLVNNTASSALINMRTMYIDP